MIGGPAVRAYLVAAVAAAAVAAPGIATLRGNAGDDSFPLSTYPMFSRERGRVSDFAVVVGYDTTGRAHRLSPTVIGGSDQVIHAATTVRNAIIGGPGASDELCIEILGRVLDADREAGAGFDRDDVVTVEIATERHDAVAWFEGDERPIERTVHATCEATVTG